MNRLGLGLLANNPEWQRIPEIGSAVLILDPRYNKVASGGFVDSIKSRVGATTYAAAGAARPIDGGDFFTYDGVDDALLTPGTQGPPPGSTRYSIGFWCKQVPAIPAVPWSFTGGYCLLIPGNVGDGMRWHDNALNAVCTNVVPANQWGFFAITFDGSRALGSRARLYVGATAATVTLVASAIDTLPATWTGPSAGANQGFQAWTKFANSCGLAGVWNTELTQAQLRAFAAIRQPF